MGEVPNFLYNLQLPMTFRFGVFELDPQTGELRKSGLRVRLAPQPFTVLSILASRPGDVVTRDELRTALWGDNTFIEFDQGLNTCIRQIRAVLGDDADVPRYVETLPRRGYRLIVPVDTIGGEPAPPPAIAAPPTPAASDPPAPVAARAWSWKSAAAIIVLAGAIAAAIGIPSFRVDPERPANKGPVTIAVLPLANLSKDVNQDVLADGVTEALIHDLAQIRAMRVISRTSVMRFKDTTQPLHEIARQLGADLILEGSFQQSGDRVRLTLQLVEAATDYHRFSRSFDTTADQLFDTQREVARHIATEVTAEITPGERARLNATRTVNPDAYRSYLIGRHFWNRRGLENLRSAETHFKRAVEIDPRFAMGHAALAETYVLLGDGEYAGMPPREASKLTHEEAGRALALDPSLGDAHAAQGLARFQFDWDWETAEQDFKKALALSPHSATAWSWYGWLQVSRGRFDAAIDAFERAQVIDPLSLTAQASAGDAYYFAGRYDEAMARYEATLKMDSAYIGALVAKGRVLETLGKYQEALAHYEDVLKARFELRIFMAAARAQAALGDMTGATARLAELKRGATTAEMPALFRAYEAFIIDDYDAAFTALNDAVEERSSSLIYLIVGPALDSFRDDPRLLAVIKRINPELATIKRVRRPGLTARPRV